MNEEMKMNEQQPENSTPEANGGQGSEKAFTQEEVNRIVAERLARERAKGAPSETDKREMEITQREQLADGNDWLMSKGLPADLATIIGAKPLPEFKDSARQIMDVFYKMQREAGRKTAPQQPQTADSLFRTAFGLERKE